MLEYKPFIKKVLNRYQSVSDESVSLLLSISRVQNLKKGDLLLDIGKISVGPPYFNYISTFIILPLVFIMTPGILSNWRKTDFSKIYKRSAIYIIFSFILSILILKIFYNTNLLITITALAIAFFTVIGSLIKLSQAIKIKFSQTKSFMKSIFIKNKGKK